MKRIIYLLSTLGLLVILSSSVLDDNGKAGYVGSPGETTCNTSNCHNSFVLNTGGGSVTARSDMDNWTYEPFQTYNISITVAKSGVGLFGFGVELLTSTNANAGTLNITDAAKTQIKSRVVSAVTRRNVVHKLNAGLSQDSMVFNFSWTAPDTSTGDLTMYFAGNCTNANGQPSGDYIYNGTQVITPADPSTVGVNTLVVRDAFRVTPNPASDRINLHYNLNSNEHVRIVLHSISGARAYELLDAYQQAGENNISLDLPISLESGIYLLNLEGGSSKVSQKLLIQ